MDSKLHKLFITELQDIYSAEKQIAAALPELIETAASDKLQEAFLNHLKDTDTQIERLEEIRSEFNIDLEGKECIGMKGLIKEGEEIVKKSDLGSAMDSALIGAAQRIEHYEIAAYGTAIALAEAMNHNGSTKLLKQTLKEEEQTDKKFTDLAKKVNKQAAFSAYEENVRFY